MNYDQMSAMTVLQLLALASATAFIFAGFFAPGVLDLRPPDHEAVSRLCFALGAIGLLTVVALRSLRNRLMESGRLDLALFSRIAWAAGLAACLSAIVIGLASYDINRDWWALTTTRKTLFFELPVLLGVLLVAAAILPRVVWVNIWVLVFLWAVAEVGFGLAAAAPERVNTREAIKPDGPIDVAPESRMQAHMRWAPAESAGIKLRLRIGDETVYDAVYTKDRFGRRHTPIAPDHTPEHFAIFFGGSFTFGEGLEDDETIPYYFGQLMPGYRPYNYAAGGRGPSDMLELLWTGSIADEIEEKDGVAFFLFMDDHVRRVVGSMTFWLWGKTHPRYVLDSNGEIARTGTFMDDSVAKIFLYSLLNRSNVLRSFNFDIPLVYGQREYETIAKVIAKSRDLLQEQFPRLRFYLVVYPGPRGERLIQAIEGQSIRVIHLKGMIDMDREEFHLHRYDGHPTALANRIVADAIAKALEHEAQQ